VLSPPPPDVCFEPVHQVTLASERVDRGRFVVGVYDMTIGYTLRSDEVRVGGSGLQQSLSASAVPVASTSEYRDRALQIDLAAEVTKLTRRAARELVPPL
jgi:hypothetical protein